MSKHTPGPWVVNGFGGDYVPIAKMLPHGVIVSSTSAPGDEIANARLIAAAPELYEALRRVPIIKLRNDAGGWLCYNCRAGEDESCVADCYVPLVEAAIAKAEGRS